MGNGNLNFNAEEIEPASTFEPVPAGWYDVIINDSEMKPTRAGDGSYLELAMQVIDGPHSGRLLWDRLTLDHPNEQTVEIARRTLSGICHACHKLRVADSSELHNIPLRAKVVVRKQEGYADKNEIKGYAPAGSEGLTDLDPVPPVRQAAPARPAAKPAASVPPWARKKAG